MKRKGGVLFVLLLCWLLVAGCGASQTDQADADAKKGDGKTYRIGFSMCNLTIEYLAMLRDEILAYRSSLGLEDKVELIILDATSDPLLQNSQVDNLISQKVDCIIMIPFDREQQVPAVEAAARAKIPLMEFCASTTSRQKITYVGSEDKQSGTLLAKELLETAKQRQIVPKIVILHGPTGQNAEVMRHTGLQEVMRQYPEAKIVREFNCEWDRSKALASMGNILQSGLDFNMVFSENDEMAMGALIACEAAGRKDILIGGVDALPDALDAVIDGRMICTVFQNAKKQSMQAFDIALKICKGEQVAPSYIIDYELVTKENAERYK